MVLGSWSKRVRAGVVLVSAALLAQAGAGCGAKVEMPICQAIAQRNHGQLEANLNAKHNANERCAENSRSPLHNAVELGDAEAVRLLLANGAEVNARDPLGKTALHLATNNGNESVVRAILEKKPVVDAPDEQGRTPLHVAAQRGQTPIATLLIDVGGSNPNVQDKAGQTPSKVAQDNNRIETARAIRERGGK